MVGRELFFDEHIEVRLGALQTPSSLKWLMTVSGLTFSHMICAGLRRVGPLDRKDVLKGRGLSLVRWRRWPAEGLVDGGGRG